ncbi:hypothetical protein B0H10DRAFT_1949757 [Mycena sp. CBHHK59/15]|nr:hypothetical protein B0H10DRAFT_1949757 [Mycena sp. CBHHK59/15]
MFLCVLEDGPVWTVSWLSSVRPSLTDDPLSAEEIRAAAASLSPPVVNGQRGQSSFFWAKGEIRASTKEAGALLTSKSPNWGFFFSASSLWLTWRPPLPLSRCPAGVALHLPARVLCHFHLKDPLSFVTIVALSPGCHEFGDGNCIISIDGLSNVFKGL